ncbi:STAS domain-containing protein [candidate division KSB1 bacterium]|nr:STAS domain-containing protein [candidate division KSB1 bacterium]
MEIDVAASGNTISAKLVGAITEGDSKKLKTGFDQLRDAGAVKVVVDLTHVPTISSSGIGKLIALYRRVKEQKRDFEVHGIHENLYALFKSIHLDKLFLIKR